MDIQKWLWKQVGVTAAKEGITKRELVEKALFQYTHSVRIFEDKGDK